MSAPKKEPAPVTAGRSSIEVRRRYALLVLGMHRSGTSALARMLNLLGCDLPATLIPAGRGNEAGHWESQRIVQFNDRLLAALGSVWDDWLPANPRFPETPQWPGFVEEGRAVLRQEFADSPMFVLKDPRICRLLPFWLEVLAAEGVEPAIVVPLRNPIEVARSLVARDGFDEYYGLLLWLRHVLDAEATSRGLSRVFVSYDELLDDWEVLAEKIATSTGLVWPRLSPNTAIELEEFLGADLRHHAVGSRDLAHRRMLSPWVSEIYAIFSDWVANGERAEDYERLDAIAASFEVATPMFARPMLSARETRQKLAQSQVESETLRRERDAVAQDHASLREELDAVVAERDHLTQRHDAMVGERDALAGRLQAERAASQAQITELELEQAQSAEAHRELGHSLAVMTSTLHQREEEIAQLGAMRDRHISELAHSQDVLSKLQASQAAQRDQLITAHAELAERSAESVTLTKMLKQAEAESAELRRALDEAEVEHVALAAERDTIRAAHKAVSGEIGAARDEIAERFKELSLLTFMLRTSEDMARARDGDVEWLLNVGAALTHFPGWWGLAPSRIRQRWIERRLKQRGLFDAEAYHARYKDVADAGMASLRHYLLHGLREGRNR